MIFPLLKLEFIQMKLPSNPYQFKRNSSTLFYMTDLFQDSFHQRMKKDYEILNISFFIFNQ